MKEKILVTGGAGFIGSHLVDALLHASHHVRILDNLESQVHGSLSKEGMKPDYLNSETEFILGDIRDPVAVARALEGIDVVFHEAALVGVGQSMYEIERYTNVNSYGASVLLQAIVNMERRPRKIIVASSMSIYGEGAYECQVHGLVYPKLRENSQLLARNWEIYCPNPGCQEQVSPCPTAEDKQLFPTSIYAINKRDHEEMFMSVGHAYNIPAVALRYFNTYGSRQALSNPYTGVAAIFSNRILNNNPPVIFEDGRQSRDFVHVRDVVQANLLVMDDDCANYEVFNVGTGNPISILEVAEVLNAHITNTSMDPSGNRMEKDSYEAVITGEFRAGDIRHCYPDIGRLRKLGYEPSVSFEEGVSELVNFLIEQSPVDSFNQARHELTRRGLTI